MRLSDRLMMSVSMIPKGARVADVGCDHGKSSIYLVKNGISEKQIAMDLREGPLAHARENIAYFGLSDKIECRLSDGIQKLEPGEADTLLICGMGGMLTIEILSAKPEVIEQINTLVLQPQSDIGRVREYIMSRGYEIINEKTCFELGKFYNAILAERVSDTMQEAAESRYLPEETEFGKILLERRDPVLKNRLDAEYKKALRVIERLSKEDTENARERLEEYMRIRELFEAALSRYS